MKNSDQLILERLYSDIQIDNSYIQIEVIDEGLKQLIKKLFPYALAAGMTLGSVNRGNAEINDPQDFRVDKTYQYSTLSPKDFYKKAKKQEDTGKYSDTTVETFTKSIKTYLIKKLNNNEELKEATDVYVDIVKITDKGDGNILISIDISGKIFAESQTEANIKAAAAIKKALEESNVSVRDLKPLVTESSKQSFPFKFGAKIYVG